MKIKHRLLLLALCLSTFVYAQKSKTFTLLSPDGKIQCSVNAGATLSWSLLLDQQPVITPSLIAMRLSGGESLGNNMQIISSKTSSVRNGLPAIIYKKDLVANQYNQLTLVGKGSYGVIFRAYDDGIAYRFFTSKKDSITVNSEDANFNFSKDYNSFIPYVRDPRVPGDPYVSSYEALYREAPLSAFVKDTLAFLPLLVDLGDEKKAAITEVDLENYPGMFMQQNPQNPLGLKAVFAPYPLEETTGGYHHINYVPTKRADYIAKTSGKMSFPWRVLILSRQDKDLANNDMVFKLSEPSRITDPSWIKPGKVSWDWWNDWNISHVDFKAGINNDTYKYYIDFASANHIEYVILDEGWSSDSDLFKLSSAIDLQELISYGKTKDVGIILWSSWYALHQNMETAFARYASVGVKGFKIDFLDRDDQEMTSSTYAIAASAAGHKLLVDFHGVYKPDGLQYTYPNVLNFEGVKGMENVKWTPNDDVPRYDVSLPFIRMLAGPMDYTPGAMRNTIQSEFHFSHSMPMSQGTRCHQLAMYTVFHAPLQMLADNPTSYMKEPESTAFIAKVPTTFNETVALDGKVGEFISIARRRGDVWFVAAMTNWTARDLTIDLSFLKPGSYEAVIFQDGLNADRDATDYKKTVQKVKTGDKLNIRLAPGGGWTARIYPIR